MPIGASLQRKFRKSDIRTGRTISPGVNSVQVTWIVPEPATWMML